MFVPLCCQGEATLLSQPSATWLPITPELSTGMSSFYELRAVQEFRATSLVISFFCVKEKGFDFLRSLLLFCASGVLRKICRNLELFSCKSIIRFFFFFLGKFLTASNPLLSRESESNHLYKKSEYLPPETFERNPRRCLGFSPKEVRRGQAQLKPIEEILRESNPVRHREGLESGGDRFRSLSFLISVSEVQQGRLTCGLRSSLSGDD